MCMIRWGARPHILKNHKFILVETNYFTKWVEVVPLKNVMSRDTVEFVKEHIVYLWYPSNYYDRSGDYVHFWEFEEFATSMRIKLLNSSPYYAQAHGQAEASNKRIITLIKRKIDEQPKH